MIRYKLVRNNNKKSDFYNKWYAYPVIEETVELDQLAEHMANHNTPFSKGAIKGMLTDMISCVKELLLEGKNVKLPDLAIFSIGIKNKSGGADSVETFTAAENLTGVKLRARATGQFTGSALKLEATLRKATQTVVKETATE